MFQRRRREIPGWNLPEFDDSGWKNALPCESPRGEFRICEAEPIRPTGRILEPVSVVPAKGIAPYQAHPKTPVVVDPDGTIVELDAANNAAWSDAVTVSPAYVTEDVACDKAVYGTGEKITVTGVAVKPDGVTRAANVDVEVYLASGGLRRTLAATTDDEGEFAASYTPMTGEAGRFEVGASYPGIGAAAVQATCDVAGFALGGLPDARYVEDLTLGDVVTNAAARVRNPCAIALTGVTAEAVGLPESCALEFVGLPADGSLAVFREAAIPRAALEAALR